MDYVIMTYVRGVGCLITATPTSLTSRDKYVVMHAQQYMIGGISSTAICALSECYDAAQPKSADPSLHPPPRFMKIQSKLSTSFRTRAFTALPPRLQTLRESIEAFCRDNTIYTVRVNLIFVGFLRHQFYIGCLRVLSFLPEYKSYSTRPT